MVSRKRPASTAGTRVNKKARPLPQAGKKYPPQPKGNNRRTGRRPAPTVKVNRIRHGAEIKFRKVRGGMRRRRATTGQLQKLSTVRNISRFHNVGPLDKGNDVGPMILGSALVSSTLNPGTLVGTGINSYVQCVPTTAPLSTATHFYTPCHMYLLNGTQYSGTAARVAYQTYLGFDGSVVFTPLAGASPAGLGAIGISEQWQGERESGTIVADRRYVRQDWYDINVCLRNAKAQATVYELMVVGFKDSHLDPLDTATTVHELSDRRAFYKALLGWGAKHPIQKDPGFSKARGRLRVYKKVTVVMDKQMNTENDASPDCKVVRWFIRDGRLYDYVWHANPGTQGDLEMKAQFLNQNKWGQQGLQNQTSLGIPKARARRWLVIRALDQTVTASDASADDSSFAVGTNTPSYDIILRKSETISITGE